MPKIPTAPKNGVYTIVWEINVYYDNNYPNSRWEYHGKVVSAPDGSRFARVGIFGRGHATRRGALHAAKRRIRRDERGRRRLHEKNIKQHSYRLKVRTY